MTSPPPWHLRNLGGLMLGQLLCIALVLAAGQAAANRASIHDQSAWLNMAVVAAVVSGLLNGVWLMRLRRATGRRRRTLLGHLDAAAEEPDSVAMAPPSDEPLVAVPGMTLVHRPGCPLVAGKRVEPATDGVPCGWCLS